MPKYLLIILSLVFFQTSYAQLDKSEDSLINKSFGYLEERIKAEDINIEKRKIYIDAYLKKAKKEKDTIEIGNGFYHKAFDYPIPDNINFYKRGLRHADSMIYFTKKLNHKTFPGLSYISKGYFYFYLDNNRKALENYLIAQEYAQKHNNKVQLYELEGFINAIRTQDKSNIENIKKELDSLVNQKSNGKKELSDYLIVLNNYISNLQREKKYKEAEHYILEGINESKNIKPKYSDQYYSFVFSSGINNYFLNKYDVALDSINKSENLLNINSLTLAYYLKGKIHHPKDTIKAIQYFNKVDSIFQINHTNIYGLFDNYKSLIAIHKANNNYTKQIESIDKLIFADSTVNANKIYYEDKILNEYEIPKYKHEKESIILKLKKQNRKKEQNNIYLASILVLVSISSAYFFRKQKVYKKRYDQLLLDEKPKKIKTFAEDKNKLDISKDNIESILSGLDAFEQQHNYTDNTINQSTLAKKIGTNPTYLSKVVNKLKGKSFSQYLNDLRIDYAIQELKQNKTMRMHTIDAVAKEVGFNNAESFSKAFYKKVKIYPSYFIKQLNKDNL